MEKKQIILPKLRYEKAPAIDSQIRIGFEEEKSLLRTDDRDIVLDLSEQFAKERSDCNRYMIYGKMKMVFRNLYLGVSDYDYLKQRLALYSDGTDGCYAGYLPYDEFAFLRNDIYREAVDPMSMSSLDTFSGFTLITSGTTLHQEITAFNAPHFNWNLYTTYVYDHNDVFPMKYTLSGSTKTEGDNILTFLSGDGIPFRVQTGTTEYILTSPVIHGINQGEFVIINSIPYYVNSIGNEVYNSENYVINIAKSQLTGGTFNTLVNGKRCTDINDINNSTSEYYVHIHKVLTSIDDYILDKVGFESPIWQDEKKLLFENSAGINDVVVERNRMEAVLFDFKEPFILSGITNNLGYTPTDIYVSMVFRNGNGFFEYPPKVGYKFNFHDSWIDDHFSGNTSSEIGLTGDTFVISGITFTSGRTMSIGDTLIGAFVEYNPKEMKERIISESFHKIVSNVNVFNHGQTLTATYSGATDDNPIGLYYQPHYRFKMRELSPYTEISNTDKVENLPENTRYFSSEKLWRWRDLYDDGYIDIDGYGTDYPYMNNIHYIHRDINFYLRNEQIFTNKKDGLISFFVKGADECHAVLLNPTVTVTTTVTPTVTPTPPASGNFILDPAYGIKFSGIGGNGIPSFVYPVTGTTILTYTGTISSQTLSVEVYGVPTPNSTKFLNLYIDSVLYKGEPINVGETGNILSVVKIFSFPATTSPTEIRIAIDN
jgi:hypothetical protein